MKRMFSKKIIMIALSLACLSAVLLTSGCAARANKMVPCDFEVVSRHPYTVSVNESTGGIDAKPLWYSQISNTAFTEALSDALQESGVFQNVIEGGGVDASGGADYILDVTILEYDQPWHGANIDIRMKTKWQLTNAKTLAPVWSSTFKTAYMAVWINSIFDGKRIEEAQEGSARTNIKEGIRRISALSL